MANRIPLIVNPDVSQIQELPASDTLFIANGVDVNGSMDISTNLTLSSTATASTRFIVNATTAATNTTSGCATFAGGLGVAGALHVGGGIHGSLTGNVTGDVTGAASQITVADESSDTDAFLVFTNTATGNNAPKTGTNLTFNSSTGALSATKFVGDGSDLTGTGAQSSFINNYAETTYNNTSNSGAYNSFKDHLSINLTPSGTNNRVMVMASFQIKRTTNQNNNWYAKARISGGGDLQPIKVVSTNSISYTDSNTFSIIAYDAAGNTSQRTYKLQVQYTASSASSTGLHIKNAALWAVELKA